MASTKRAFELGFAIDEMAVRMAASERKRAYVHADSLKPGRLGLDGAELARLERVIRRRHKALQRLIRALANLSTGDQLNVT